VRARYIIAANLARIIAALRHLPPRLFMQAIASYIVVNIGGATGGLVGRQFPVNTRPYNPVKPRQIYYYIAIFLLLLLIFSLTFFSENFIL